MSDEARLCRRLDRLQSMLDDHALHLKIVRSDLRFLIRILALTAIATGIVVGRLCQEYVAHLAGWVEVGAWLVVSVHAGIYALRSRKSLMQTTGPNQ